MSRPLPINLGRLAPLMVPLAAASSAWAPAPQVGVDKAGASDHPFINRYAGSTLYTYGNAAYGIVPMLTVVQGKPVEQAIEGEVANSAFWGPPGRAALEVFRSYQSALRSAGYNIVSEGETARCDTDETQPWGGKPDPNRAQRKRSQPRAQSAGRIGRTIAPTLQAHMILTFRHLFLMPWIPAALLASSASLAQTSDATRYVNPQGIEVIQARRPPATVAAPVPLSKAAVSAPATPTKGNPNMQVSASEQSARDGDRLAILQQELASETSAFDTKLRIAQSAPLRAKLQTEELRRLQETMLDHEKNIRSLNAEIARVRIIR